MPEEMLFGAEIGPEPELRTELVPEIDLSPVASTWSQFGCDQNGRPMISEMYLVLDRDHVTEESDQELWLGLWAVMTGERAAVQNEKMEKIRRETQAGK